MGTNKKVRNQAEEHLIVGSIEVIGDVSGGSFKTIKKNVEVLQDSFDAYYTEQEDYWTTIASDGIISPIEKKTLYKEWKNIEQTYTALIALAHDKLTPEEYDKSDRVKAIIRCYTALYTYLFTTIKVFDNMEKDTEIADREVFNLMYTQYYEAELALQITISQGLPGEDGQIRVITSLTDIGTEGEVALYNNHIYRYVSGSWSMLDTQEDYWTELTADTNITPLEKHTLYKEWLAIQQEKTAVDLLAADQNLSTETRVSNYHASYDALNIYLNTTLNLFEDITTTTEITDRTTFNTIFDNYYKAYAAVFRLVSSYAWDAASDDAVITPAEKLTIKKEITQITRTYNSLMDKAVKQESQGTAPITAYTLSYSNLYQAIYQTLKVFEHMDQVTELAERDQFDELWALYYVNESLASQALAAGDIGTVDIRVLESLDEPGNENELAAYAGELYQFYNGHWKKLGTNGYLGLQSSLPTELEGNYFLAEITFGVDQALKLPEGGIMEDPSGAVLYWPFQYLKGFLYEYNSYWKIVDDKYDYRYIVAMADLAKIGEGLPAFWQDQIDELQDQIDANTQQEQTLSQQIAAHTGEFTVINGKIVLIDNSLLEDKSSIEALQSGAETTAGKVSTLEGTVETISGDLETTGGKVSTLEGTVETISGDLETTSGKVSTLEGTVETISGDLETAKGDISTLQTGLNNATASMVTHIPIYLGLKTDPPTSTSGMGDWFCYSGTFNKSSEEVWSPIASHNKKLEIGYCYRKVLAIIDYTPKIVWQWLDPTSSDNLNYYQITMKDIMSIESVKASLSPGYFSVLLCQALFAQAAAIDTLQVQNIQLTATGVIRTQGYVVPADFEPSTDVNGGSYIDNKGNAVFTGTVYIGGIAKINGICNVDKLHFNKSYTAAEAASFNNGDIWLHED